MRIKFPLQRSFHHRQPSRRTDSLFLSETEVEFRGSRRIASARRFAAMADVAKGGDGAESAGEILTPSEPSFPSLTSVRISVFAIFCKFLAPPDLPLRLCVRFYSRPFAVPIGVHSRSQILVAASPVRPEAHAWRQCPCQRRRGLPLPLSIECSCR
jgi:hypothetical protein